MSKQEEFEEFLDNKHISCSTCRYFSDNIKTERNICDGVCQKRENYQPGAYSGSHMTVSPYFACKHWEEYES